MAELTTKQRRGLKKSEFLRPPTPTAKAGGFKGSFPFDTEERARNALARASAQVSRGMITRLQFVNMAKRIKQKFPDIEIAVLKKKDSGQSGHMA